MTEKLPNIDAPQQDKTAEVAPLPKSAELLIKLNTLNFPDTQKNVLQSIISSRELEFKGTVRQNTVDVLYKNMQRLDNIASITTLSEQRAFLEEIKQQLNGVGSQHSQWEQYKKAQNEPGMESQRIVAGFFKGLIATGIAIKGLIDMKNGQQGLGALEAGLAAYILRVDKWLDPMNFLAKEVKFLQGQEWKNLKPKNVSQADWASLCGKIIQSNGAKTSSFDENQKQTWEKLTNAQKNRLETLLLSVKTDSGKQTVTAYLNGQSIRSTPTPKYSETPTAAPTKNTAPQGPTLAPTMPAAAVTPIASPRPNSSDLRSTSSIVQVTETPSSSETSNNTVNINNIDYPLNTEVVTITNNAINEEDIQNLMKLTKLRVLSLKDTTNLDAPTVTKLAQIPNFTQLSLNKLTSLDLQTAEALAALPHLVHLDLNKITTLDVQTAEALAKNPNLVGLSLKGLTTLDQSTASVLIRKVENVGFGTSLDSASRKIIENEEHVQNNIQRCNTDANEYNLDPKKRINLFYEDGKMDEAKKLCSEHGIQNITVNEKFRELRGNFSDNVQSETLKKLAVTGIFTDMEPAIGEYRLN
jgi:hypothetical protein